MCWQPRNMCISGPFSLSIEKIFSSVTKSCPTLYDPMDPASLSITNFWSLLKLMSIESVIPSDPLILCCPLLLLPSIFPSIRVFSNESVLHIRWPQYCRPSQRRSEKGQLKFLKGWYRAWIRGKEFLWSKMPRWRKSDHWNTLWTDKMQPYYSNVEILGRKLE